MSLSVRVPLRAVQAQAPETLVVGRLDDTHIEAVTIGIAAAEHIAVLPIGIVATVKPSVIREVRLTKAVAADLGIGCVIEDIVNDIEVIAG